MIWYVYDKNRSGADTAFFYNREKALRWKINRAASTGGDMAIRWCHAESVPEGATIH